MRVPASLWPTPRRGPAALVLAAVLVAGAASLRAEDALHVANLVLDGLADQCSLDAAAPADGRTVTPDGMLDYSYVTPALGPGFETGLVRLISRLPTGDLLSCTLTVMPVDQDTGARLMADLPQAVTVRLSDLVGPGAAKIGGGMLVDGAPANLIAWTLGDQVPPAVMLTLQQSPGFIAITLSRALPPGSS
jgi:hypothetical protein